MTAVATAHHNLTKPPRRTRVRPNRRLPASSSAGLRVKAYRGDGSVMLAFNLDAASGRRLRRICREMHSANRQCVLSQEPSELRQQGHRGDNTGRGPCHPHRFKQGPLPEVPLGRFFLVQRGPGKYTYEVSAMYQAADGGLAAKATTSVTLELGPFRSGNLRIRTGSLDSFHRKPTWTSSRMPPFDRQRNRSIRHQALCGAVRVARVSCPQAVIFDFL